MRLSTRALATLLLVLSIFAVGIAHYYVAPPMARAQSALTSNLDPCTSNTPKSTAFATITTATTTALVTVSGTTSVYVCGVTFEISGTTTAGTILFEQGTGLACAGAPTALTATYTDAGTSIADLVFNIGSGGTTMFKAASANGLCAVTTVGTAPSIPVTVTYIQQ